MSNRHNLSHFITIEMWQNALKLLNFQIQQRQKNKHYNSLSIFYYEKLGSSIEVLKTEEYFRERIASSLFYGLTKEFSAITYIVPKFGLGLRKLTFLTYPMRAVLYSIGLYLLRLTQEFLTEQFTHRRHIQSYYGGGIFFDGDNLNVTANNTYYRQYYRAFRKEIRKEASEEIEDKLVVRVDIENYYNELSIPKLLALLEEFVKASTRHRLKFDTDSIEQIRFFYRFLTNGNSGIPQATEDIVSAFVAHLYLSFGDLLIDDELNKSKLLLKKHAIIRYLDDIYVSITFNDGVDAASRASYATVLSESIADILYHRLGLRVNTKTSFYWLNKDEDRDKLMSHLKKVSGVHIAPEDGDIEPQGMVEDLLGELDNLKRKQSVSIFDDENKVNLEVFKNIFERSVDQLLSRADNAQRLKDTLIDFNFDLVKLCPLELLILILKNAETKEAFRQHFLTIPRLLTKDAEVGIDYLCQTEFTDHEFLNKLRESFYFEPIVNAFISADIASDDPGYFNLNGQRACRLANMPNVIEQVRFRVYNEVVGAYSVALSHLLNEIHAICRLLDQSHGKEYDVNNVVRFLQKQGVSNMTTIKIRNLFDRRNTNQISHPSTEHSIAWGVNQSEYEDYRAAVAICLDSIL